MSTKKYKVAAIVSAYYCEEFLPGRIDNLLSHYSDLQVVIVAQLGSKELEIAEAAAEDLENILIFRTEDIPTVYEAWNLGIEASDSEYITSANSDDRHLVGGLKILAGMLDDHPEYGVAYSDIERVEEIGGEAIGNFRWNEGGLKELLAGCFLGPMPMWRRSLHEKYGMFDASFTVAGDYEFWMRLAAGEEKFYHVKSMLGSHLEKKDCLEHRSPVRTIWETAKARGLYRAKVEV